MHAVRSGACAMAVALGQMACHSPVRAPGSVSAEVVSAAIAAPLRVLFVGNSYTYYNNFPEIVAGLSVSARGSRPIVVKSLTRPGVPLQVYLTSPDLRDSLAAALKEAHWDYVVLQEQSRLGFRMVNGEPGISEPQDFFKFARILNGQIQQAGARTAFLLTWADRTHPQDQDALSAAYMRIGRELGALVIPAGLAWQQVHRERPSLDMNEPDRKSVV